MAPNRKQLACVLDLPLTDTVQAKFLPLTTEVATSTPATPAEPTIIRSNNVDDDYWGWEAPAEKKDLFSASSMIEMEAQRLSTAATTKKTVAAHDDYWAERVEARYSPENAAVSETTGYWEWPQDATPVQIALILKEEFARQQVSGERMEERLRQDASAVQKHYLTKAENDDYWGWETPTTVHAEPSQVSESYWEWDGAVKTEATKQQEVVAAILAYEKVRTLFSSEHVQQQLLKESATTTCTTATQTNNTANDSYWNWPAQESDDYWNMRPTAAVTTAATQGYWDW